MTLAQDDVEEFVYKLPGYSTGQRPGAHKSLRRGSGMHFSGHARLFDQPDPRRLDLRASLSNVHNEWLVKTHLQRSSITITVIVDVSSSMHFGNPGKLAIVAHFLRSLGRSANAFGDSIRLLAFDSEFRSDLYLPATKSRAFGMTMSEQILACRDRQARLSQPDALADCLPYVADTSLLFLISDFHTLSESLHATLNELDNTCLVPMVVWANAEVNPPANNQWLAARDMGTDRSHHLWINRRTRTNWREKVEQRRTTLSQLFSSHDASAFFITGEFKAADLSSYFLEDIV